MAQAGTKTFNLSSQAKKLVSEMRGNPNIDFKHDWKMVTVLVGKAYVWLAKVDLRAILFYVFKFVQWFNKFLKFRFGHHSIKNFDRFFYTAGTVHK